jgi:glutamate racemase
LSVLRELTAQLPHEHFLYLADQAKVPYGKKSHADIRRFSKEIVEFLLSQKVKLIVVACNTATAAALTYLRETFPHYPFVGMEPAVKPAVQLTRSGKIGVLATAGTFRSERYADLTDRFARHLTMHEDPCYGLVERIEAGELDSPGTSTLLSEVLAPMLADGVDTFVLGCTHYPFVQSIIERLAGTGAVVVNPAPAVARRTANLLSQHHLATSAQTAGSTRFYTTGDPAIFQNQILALLGVETTASRVELPEHTESLVLSAALELLAALPAGRATRLSDIGHHLAGRHWPLLKNLIHKVLQDMERKELVEITLGNKIPVAGSRWTDAVRIRLKSEDGVR